jgi:hypothetical protein
MKSCLLLFTAACLAACGASPPAPAIASSTDAWLARFRDAMTFLPAGMASHWFHDHAALPATEGIEPGSYRMVRCGRRFQAPRDIGVGAYDGVEITDYGTAGIPVAARADLGVAGLQERWTAFVGERFVVAASSEELLREALQRRGPPRIELLERVTTIEPAACDVVVRNLSPADIPGAVGGLLMLNVPGVRAVVEIVPSPYRVRLFGVDETELRALARCAFPFDWTWRATAGVPGMCAIELAATSDAESGAPPAPAPAPIELLQHAGLSQSICFGLWIFI